MQKKKKLHVHPLPPKPYLPNIYHHKYFHFGEFCFRLLFTEQFCLCKRILKTTTSEQNMKLDHHHQTSHCPTLYLVSSRRHRPRGSGL